MRFAMAVDVGERGSSSGPLTKDGWMVVISRPSLPASAHAAFSARVLLTAYEDGMVSGDQSSAVNGRLAVPLALSSEPPIAATLDVRTTLFTPAAAAARSTLAVPSRAVLISSSVTSPPGKGDAT